MNSSHQQLSRGMIYQKQLSYLEEKERLLVAETWMPSSSTILLQHFLDWRK